VVGATVSLANLIELLVLPDWVARHVTGGVGRYEFPTQFIQWSPIIVSNGYDVALRPAHARISLCKTIGSRSPISEPNRFSLSR
jgi:hypothetical protein